MIIRTRRAQKEHYCYGCSRGEKIKPGETYVEETAPPWIMVCDDPDGGSSRLDEWITLRYHPECRYY